MPIHRSLAVLRAEASPPGLLAVAAVAPAQAVAEHLDVPNDTGLLLWSDLRRSPEAGMGGRR